MITSSAFAGKTYAVLGLARSGVATVEALLASGAKVTAWDSKEEARQKILPGPPRAGEELILADPLEIDLTGYAGVVVSPGVPLNKHPIAAHAAKFSVPVIGDIELFAQARRSLPPHQVVGITGTNGKSTTTALIKHIIETAGVPTLMGGNIGLPIMGRDPLEAGGVYVLELSSYQIDLTFSLDCEIAVLTNITPDHLDRYDGFAGYAASKERLFALQSNAHVGVIAIEDEPSRAIAARHRRARPVTSRDVHGQEKWPALQGPHNAQNAAIAIAVAEELGVPDGAIEKGLATYPGLPHRMERIAEKRGILFVNDSKATNATATAPALGAYPKIHWILGGLPKTDDLDDCAPYFDHVAAAYTIGQAGPMYARILKEAGKPVTESGTLDQAVRDAAAAARSGEVVMLSPACASFDQFSDYEARGDAFRRAVEGLSLWPGIAVPFESSVPSPSSPFKRSRFGRGKRTPFARWFWEIDRVLLLLVTMLIGIGLIAVAAASPAAGVRYSGNGVTVAARHYFWMQLGWTIIAVPVMIGVSALPLKAARRLALIGGAIFVLLLALVPVIGATANGATRWIGIGGAKIQPSEFLKPMFAVGMAWLFSLRTRNPGLPFALISVVPMVVIAALLMKQPDFGQTVIFVAVWVVLLMLSGASLKLLGMLGAGGLAAIVSAYFFYSVATERIDKFLFKEGDTYQVDRAHATLTNGGLLGTGPGAGTEKFSLPEPHTDYIFSVIGEEFGLIACIAIACLYLAIIARVCLRLLREEDDFLLLASAGLVSQFGLQALINMLVNVGLAPSKGMTLPFISYGGSSMIALSVGFGLLLAFTRENPHLKEATYTVRWNSR